ncbi:MAG: GNAT family N-acetyltransferase [Saprospiraceae bacterium]
MNEIELNLNEELHGAFVIEEGDHPLAEMEFAISGDNLVVYHTEVAEAYNGRGFGPKLLLQMVDYARKNNYKVIALCSYVNTQFKDHPEDYADVWNKEWKQ